MRRHNIIRKCRTKWISIHAPLTGCDLIPTYNLPVNCDFNPRTPYGMRQFELDTRLLDDYISIHAPLTGCDLWCWRHSYKQINFNPRTPYGMRQMQDGMIHLLSLFQSTHPLRDATFILLDKLEQMDIFQSTHPLRDATASISCCLAINSISIHAPLTGCDVLLMRLYLLAWIYFNPRTPYGMRLFLI